MAKDLLGMDDTILMESDLIYDKCIIRKLCKLKEKMSLQLPSMSSGWMEL